MADVELLRRYTPLHNLNDANLDRLARRLEIEVIPKGAVICNEGGTDNDSIFLLDGGLELTSRGSSMRRVMQAGTPDSFFPVGPGRPRPYTVVATTPVRIFRIDNGSLDRAVLLDEVSTTITRLRESGGDKFSGDTEWLEDMMENPAFQVLPRERLALVLLRFEPKSFKSGEAIIRQGDPGDFYYVVKEGRCAVARKGDDGKIQVLSELKSGSVFGEDALLLDAPRNASIVALSDGVVMRLPRAEFDELLKRPIIQYVGTSEAQSMLKAGAGLVDVRSVEEYHQGSLKGSQNLPITELRRRVCELDSTRSYVLVCRNGRQSEAAAFMLAQRGLRVAVLRGGMAATR